MQKDDVNYLDFKGIHHKYYKQSGYEMSFVCVSQKKYTLKQKFIVFSLLC